MAFHVPSVEELQMRRADTYQQWRRAALAYDRKNRLDRWKKKDHSTQYDFVSVRERVTTLKALREEKDNIGLLFNLNEGIHGNMDGMGRPDLYRRAKFGTKRLIVEYVDAVSDALEHIASDKVKDIAFDEKLDFFHRASHCFGRTALMMSGAGSLLYFHLGVIKALWEQELLPNIMSGSSGGAFIAGIVGTRKRDEMAQLFESEFLRSEAATELDQIPRRFLLVRDRMDADGVWEAIERLIPDMTFQEAYEYSGTHINISVAPAGQYQGSRLLNAITSPNVMVREAVLASCAVPGVYPPVTLAARGSNGRRRAYLESRQWVDGSVADDLPVKRLSRLYGVNHSIVSQTNPLVLPFVNEYKGRQQLWDIVRQATTTTAKDWSLAVARILQKPFGRQGLASRMLGVYSSVLNQTYTGDINILPSTRSFNPLNLLAPRTLEEVMELIRLGERATWPAVEKIRTQTRISRTLDEIQERYEDRLVSIARKQQLFLDRSA
ncbi:MAG: DUF3336 domain-containing protein [Pseudomonadota bacterium]